MYLKQLPDFCVRFGQDPQPLHIIVGFDRLEIETYYSR
jgi:hypothetical protein